MSEDDSQPKAVLKHVGMEENGLYLVNVRKEKGIDPNLLLWQVKVDSVQNRDKVVAFEKRMYFA